MFVCIFLFYNSDKLIIYHEIDLAHLSSQYHVIFKLTMIL